MSKANRLVLSRKFQITIPREVCALYRWEPGQALKLSPFGKGVMLSGPYTWADILGIAPNANPEFTRDREPE